MQIHILISNEHTVQDVTAPRDKSRGFTAPVVPDLDNHRGRIVAVVDF